MTQSSDFHNPRIIRFLLQLSYTRFESRQTMEGYNEDMDTSMSFPVNRVHPAYRPLVPDSLLLDQGVIITQ